MSRRAMGLHLHTGAANGAAAVYIRAVRPSMVKWMDGAVDPALVALARSVGAITVLRVYQEDQDMGRVDDYLDRVKRAIMEAPFFDAYEVSYNEAHQAGADLKAKAAADIRGMQMAERHGKKAVIGSFSVGMPDLAEWYLYAPALQYAAEHGHYLGIHEYGGGSPGMRCMVTGDGPAARGWAFLRYRRVLDWARGAGVRMPKILITESGIDNLAQADRPSRGFQTVRDVVDYAEHLHWAALRLGEDDAIAGWCDFGWASEDPQWHAFDLSRDEGVLAQVMSLQARIPDAPTVPVPVPPKEAPMLEALLNAEFGLGGWEDLRFSLPSNPNGPNGDFSARQLSLIDTIAVHHTVGAVNQTWQTIAAYHIGPERGWAGIGYHLGIRMGRVAYLGGIEKGRACVGQLNHRVICVVMTGDYTKIDVSAQDKAALERLVAVLQRWSERTLARKLRVKGHGELPGQSTACPGGALSALLPGLAAIGAGPVVDTGPGAALLASGERRRVMRLNRNAALQKAMLRDGYTPVSDEFSESGYTAQLAEHLTTGAVRIYYASPSNWNNVRFFQRA
jgi:hypothetical protein